MKSDVSLSIVMPVFNEEDGIKDLFEALNRFQKRLPADTEVILVNDGSRDNSLSLLKSTKLVFHKKVINLSRNFGHQSAILAGMFEARGKIVVTMDSDLQHPLELIPTMLQFHEQGYDIVTTERMNNQNIHPFKSLTDKIFYRFINLFSEVPIRHNTSDFRSLNQKAIHSLLALPERRKFLRGMIDWIGFKQISITYQPDKRRSGTSKYTISKMLRLALHGITSFGSMPLYGGVFLGIALFFVSFLYLPYILYIRFVLQEALPGWSSVLFMQLLIGGSTLCIIGIVGLYIGAIYDEVKQRPHYLVDEITESPYEK